MNASCMLFVWLHILDLLWGGANKQEITEAGGSLGVPHAEASYIQLKLTDVDLVYNF